MQCILILFNTDFCLHVYLLNKTCRLVINAQSTVLKRLHLDVYYITTIYKLLNFDLQCIIHLVKDKNQY